jgi:hypothetical protein
MPVNYIADPWEHRSYSSDNDRDFQTRLHWLLLWNDEVRVADSFLLFNRQFERWFYQTKARAKGRQALEGIFAGKAFRVALRTNEQMECSTLMEVDRRFVRGNPDFRWYYDGPPTKRFISEIDKYLGLPDPRYSARYETSQRPNRMRECFVAALERTRGFEAVYDEFQGLRQKMPLNVANALRAIPAAEWRRSDLYTRLGYGLDRNGNVIQKGADLAVLNKVLRNDILRLIDWCYYFAVHNSLGLPTRFPGNALPLSLFELFPPTRAGLSLQQEEEEARWLQHALADTNVGSVRFEGDFDMLWKQLQALELEDFWQLRQTSAFKDYRQLQEDFETKGINALHDFSFRTSLVNAQFQCLSELGGKCGVQIKPSGLGAHLLRFASLGGAKLLTWGLAVVLASKGIPAASTLIERPITFLTARFQHTGTRKKPVKARVTYIGSIRSSD